MARLLLGKIATAHGVRGLLKILVLAENPKNLNGKMFTARTGDETLTLKLKNSLGSKDKGKFWLAEVDGITDRTVAEKLRGKELWRERDDLGTIDNANEYYAADLIGLTAQHENGAAIGKVIAIDNFGAGDLLEIQPVTGESFYLPFTNENVPAVDIVHKKLTVILPEGLL